MTARITTMVRGDGLAARLTIDRPGAAPVEIEIDVDAVEEALIALGNARAALVPAVAAGLGHADRIGVLVDPAWQIEGQTTHGLRTLALRHPGFGWLAFGLTKESAAGIADWLTRPMPDGPT